jgi:hypothetical protein
VLEERGINYARHPYKGYPPKNLTGYRYLTFHKGRQVSEEVAYFLTECDFLKMLYYWSVGDWEYKPVADQYGYIPVRHIGVSHDTR